MLDYGQEINLPTNLSMTLEDTSMENKFEQCILNDDIKNTSYVDKIIGQKV